MDDNEEQLKTKNLDDTQNEEEILTEATATEEIEEALPTTEELLLSEKDKYLRLFAEFENYKKRTQKERIDLFKTANKEMVLALLPVLDDFERGMKEIEKSDDTELVTGIQLIQNKLIALLESKGLKRQEVRAGDNFDSEQHEAITQIPAPTEELKEKIIDTVETGYTLNDKIIRYAKVVVGK